MAFDLRARISLDSTQFTYGMNATRAQAAAWGREIEKVNKQASERSQLAWGSAFAGISAAAGLALHQIQSAIKEAGDTADMANKIGVSTDFLQKWGYAAKQSGANVENIIKAVQNLAVAMEEAKAGTAEYVAAFEAIGISVDELKGKNVEQVFDEISKAMAAHKVDPAMIADMQKLFGKSGKDLIPTLRDRPTVEEGARLSNNEDVIGILKAASDQETKLGQIFRKLRGEAVAGLLRANPITGSLLLSGAAEAKRRRERDKDLPAIESQALQTEIEKRKKEEEKRQMEELAKTREKLTEQMAKEKDSIRDLNYQHADSAGKIALLKKEIADLLDQARKLGFGDPSKELEASKLREQANRKQIEIDQLEEKQFQEKGHRLNLLKSAINSDPLTSIGNFLGSDPARSNDKLTSMSSDIQAIRRLIERVGSSPSSFELFPF